MYEKQCKHNAEYHLYINKKLGVLFFPINIFLEGFYVDPHWINFSSNWKLKEKFLVKIFLEIIIIKSEVDQNRSSLYA